MSKTSAKEGRWGGVLIFIIKKFDRKLVLLGDRGLKMSLGMKRGWGGSPPKMELNPPDDENVAKNVVFI